jgi:hypothetical protein
MMITGDINVNRGNLYPHGHMNTSRSHGQPILGAGGDEMRLLHVEIHHSLSVLYPLRRVHLLRSQIPSQSS